MPKRRGYISRLNRYFIRANRSVDGFAQAGSTLIEVIVAIAIAAVAIVGLTDLFINGFDAYNLSRGYTNGVYLAQEKMEEIPQPQIRNTPPIPKSKTTKLVSNFDIRNSDLFVNMGTERLQAITYLWERKYFEKDGVPAGFVQIEVLVKWSDPHGDHKVSLTTLRPK